MSIFNIKWFDKEVEAALDKEIVKRLNVSGFIVAGEIKRVITDKGLILSGLYRDTITHELNPEELKVKIGSPITDPPYPIFLELGTARGIPAHAPMRAGLSNSKSRVKAVWR